MKIYCDIFSNEEIVSDSYTAKGEMCFEGAGCKVKSKFMTVGAENIDIGCGNAFGGNDEEEAGQEGEKVLDLIDTYHYQATSFGKKDYVTYIKGYMKKIKAKLEETNPDRVADFQKGAQDMVKWIIANFGEFEFYTPESYDTDNIIILSYYDGEDLTPTFLYFMDGLKGVLV